MTRDPSQPASNEDSVPGLLSRLTSSLRDRFASADTGAAAQAPALDPRLAPWAAKVKSAADAIEQIAGGSHVFIGTACATPTALVGALEAMRYPPADVEFVHFITNQAVPHDADGKAITKYQHRTFFVGSDIRAAVKQGLAEYVPMSISRVPQLIGNGRIRVDVALIQVVDARRVRLREPGRVGRRHPRGHRQGEAGDRRGQPGDAAVDGRLDGPRRPHRHPGAGGHARHRVRRSPRPRTRPSSGSRATSAASSRTARRCRSAWAASPTRR